jgi:hypothetical protein
MILRRFLHPRVCAVSFSGFVVTTAHYLTCATLPLLARARARAASRMPEILKRQHHKIDWLGAFLVVSGVVMLELPLTWGGQQYKWSDTPVIVTFALAGPLLIAFLYSQVRHTARRVVWAAGGATCACGVSVLLCGCIDAGRVCVCCCCCGDSVWVVIFPLAFTGRLPVLYSQTLHPSPILPLRLF